MKGHSTLQYCLSFIHPHLCSHTDSGRAPMYHTGLPYQVQLGLQCLAQALTGGAGGLILLILPQLPCINTFTSVFQNPDINWMQCQHLMCRNIFFLVTNQSSSSSAVLHLQIMISAQTQWNLITCLHLLYAPWDNPHCSDNVQQPQWLTMMDWTFTAPFHSPLCSCWEGTSYSTSEEIIESKPFFFPAHCKNP